MASALLNSLTLLDIPAESRKAWASKTVAFTCFSFFGHRSQVKLQIQLYCKGGLLSVGYTTVRTCCGYSRDAEMLLFETCHVGPDKSS
jgi:hypothetical protein